MPRKVPLFLRSLPCMFTNMLKGVFYGPGTTYG